MGFGFVETTLRFFTTGFGCDTGTVSGAVVFFFGADATTGFAAGPGNDTRSTLITDGVYLRLGKMSGENIMSRNTAIWQAMDIPRKIPRWRFSSPLLPFSKKAFACIFVTYAPGFFIAFPQEAGSTCPIFQHPLPLLQT